MKEDVELALTAFYSLEFDSKVRDEVQLVGTGIGAHPLRISVCIPDLAVIWAYLNDYLTEDEKCRGQRERPNQAYE